LNSEFDYWIFLNHEFYIIFLISILYGGLNMLFLRTKKPRYKVFKNLFLTVAILFLFDTINMFFMFESIIHLKNSNWNTVEENGLHYSISTYKGESVDIIEVQPYLHLTRYQVPIQAYHPLNKFFQKYYIKFIYKNDKRKQIQ